MYETKGPVRDAIKKVTEDKDIFVYGISDKKVGGLNLQVPGGNVAPVSPAALTGKVPEPFKSEPTAAGGVRMHHKFVVLDFDKPTARVYLGSYNFSEPADLENGENLVVVRDRRVAVSYMVQALTLFDHYHFRLLEQQAADEKKKGKNKSSGKLQLAMPPTDAKTKAWWEEDYSDPHKIKDRTMFA